jgi:hypothetical protein
LKKKSELKFNKIVLIWKKIPTITFIQLLRTKKLKNIKKTNIMKKIQKKKKKKKSYFNFIANEAEKKKKIHKIY